MEFQTVLEINFLVIQSQSLKQFADAFTNGNTSVDDANITTQINTKLADNYYKNLQVETKHGVVQIYGAVAEQNDIDKLKNLAINVPGVKQVNLDLKVKSQTSEL